MLYFDQVLNGYLSEISPKQVQDTREVREAKQEFFRVFNKALDGMIEAVFNSDTQEVREKKEAFVRTFDAAVDDLFETVEGFYTPEQVEARNNFRQAYQDASEGKVGAQYIEYTPEVKAARERFFEFFQFALDGMLYKLAPKPGYSHIPEQIADFYIKDDAEVAEAKESFDQLYRDALAGDLPSAIAYVALEDAVSNNKDDPEAAAEELEKTLNDIAEVIDEVNQEEVVPDEDAVDEANVDDGLEYDSYEAVPDEDVADEADIDDELEYDLYDEDYEEY